MSPRGFLRSGHTPTLISAFLYFDVSFMIWVILGALANAIADDFALSASQKGFLVAVPLLGGAILRVPLGMLADYWGCRRTALFGMLLTLVPLTLGWLGTGGLTELFAVGLLLGVAGASFAVALPLASRWYPPQHQGLAMGIAGAGNSGTALATLFAPRLAELFGWRAVFGFATIPIIAVLLFFWLMARESPARPQPKSLRAYLGVLRFADTWWFCWFYAVTFGGFVGLASFLSVFFRDQYMVSPVAAGTLTAVCVLSGSFLRPVGGYLADRFGGVRTLTLFYASVAVTMLAVALLPPLEVVTPLFFIALGLLGMGNGAVFQLVPNRFPKEIGTVTGIVGAAGGLGGFVLPSALGMIRQGAGSYAGGFVLCAAAAVCSSLTLVLLSQSWSSISAGQQNPIPDSAAGGS